MASCLSPQCLCGNSCTWAHEVRLHIASTNEPKITTLYIRVFQIVLGGGGNPATGGSESEILMGGKTFYGLVET